MADLDFYYPFDSIDSDRTTTAATERRFFNSMFTDGYVGASGFAVSVLDNGVFSIGAGVAVIGGAIGGLINAQQVIAQPAAGVTAYIVLRLDTTSAARKISLEVVTSLATATQEQLDQGGQHDLVLYSVTGQTGGGYGLLDQRKQAASFDNSAYMLAFNNMVAAMEEKNTEAMAALAASFQVAIDGANAENAGLYGAAGRQGFINPTFTVNQRGRTSYGITSGSAYTYDRWKATVAGRALTSAMLLQTAQEGQRHRLRITTQPFVEGASAARAGIVQNIEGGVRTFCAGGKAFTVSFDVKASEVCRVGVDAVQFATSGGAGTIAGAQVVEVGTNWQRVSVTFNGNLTPESMGDVLQIGFYVAWANYERYSDGDQTGGHIVYFANMQINEGGAAMPCHVRPYADELEACQRYCVALGYVSLGVGATLATTNQVITSPLPITRRLYRMPDATPTDRANVSGVASAEVAAGGWRNGLPCVISNNSTDAPVFVVTNSDSAAVTRVCFNSLLLNAEIND